MLFVDLFTLLVGLELFCCLCCCFICVLRFFMVFGVVASACFVVCLCFSGLVATFGYFVAWVLLLVVWLL